MIPAPKNLPGKPQHVFLPSFAKCLWKEGNCFYLTDLLLEISYQNVSLISFSLLLTTQAGLLSYNCHLELFLLHDSTNDEFLDWFWCWCWQKWNLRFPSLLPCMIGCYECHKVSTKESTCTPPFTESMLLPVMSETQLAWGVRKAETNWCNRWLFVLLFCAVCVPIETMCPHTPALGKMPSSCSNCPSQSYFCNTFLGQVPRLYTTMGYSRSSKNNTELQLKS